MSTDGTDDGSDGEWVVESRLPHPVVVKMHKKAEETAKPVESPKKKKTPKKKQKKKISKATQEIHFTFTCDHCGHDTVIALRNEGLRKEEEKKKKKKKKVTTPAVATPHGTIRSVDPYAVAQGIISERDAAARRNQQQQGYGTEWKPKKLIGREVDDIYLPLPQQPNRVREGYEWVDFPMPRPNQPQPARKQCRMLVLTRTVVSATTL
jgi:hypothetical protein